MKVKIVAYIPYGTGEDPPEYRSIIDVREAIGREWVKRGWAIALPPEEKKTEPEPEKAKAEVIETPEDKRPGLETASLKRKKK